MKKLLIVLMLLLIPVQSWAFTVYFKNGRTMECQPVYGPDPALLDQNSPRFDSSAWQAVNNPNSNYNRARKNGPYAISDVVLTLDGNWEHLDLGDINLGMTNASLYKEVKSDERKIINIYIWD
ncbi:MAG: hypothetical protein WA666_07160 [Nitrospirota bacterium]